MLEDLTLLCKVRKNNGLKMFNGFSLITPMVLATCDIKAVWKLDSHWFAKLSPCEKFATEPSAKLNPHENFWKIKLNREINFFFLKQTYAVFIRYKLCLLFVSPEKNMIRVLNLLSHMRNSQNISKWSVREIKSPRRCQSFANRVINEI